MRPYWHWHEINTE